jgi:hypothetical protein
VLVSVQSLRSVYGRSLPVAVVTDSPDEVPPALRKLVDHVIRKPVSTKEHSDKLLGMTYTPFHTTVFLDADTQICVTFDGLFKLLQYHEWAMAHEPPTHKEASDVVAGETLHLIHYNSGVMAFRRTESVLRMIYTWYDAHKSGGDQNTLVALRKIIPVPTLPLPNRYNYRTHGGVAPQGITGPVSILHSRYFRNQSWVDNKYLVSCAMLNRVTIPRLHDFNHTLIAVEGGALAAPSYWRYGPAAAP